MLKQLLIRWLFSEELAKLERYRLACSEIARWNASIPQSRETAAWINAFGEGYGPLDSSEFRDRILSYPQENAPVAMDAVYVKEGKP